MARQALGVSVRRVNGLTGGSNLYGVTYSSIKRDEKLPDEWNRKSCFLLSLADVTKSQIPPAPATSLQIIPLGLSSYDMILKFGVRETVCPKSRTTDSETCSFRQGHFVPAASCSSRVRLTADTSELVFIRCSSARVSSSSSESSSEEMLMTLPSTSGWTGHANGGEELSPQPNFPAPAAEPQGSVGHMDENNFLE